MEDRPKPIARRAGYICHLYNTATNILGIFHMLHVCTSARWSYAESTILIYVISISHRAPCGEYCKGLNFKRVDGGILFIFHHRHLRLQIPEKYARNELARALLCLSYQLLSEVGDKATVGRGGKVSNNERTKNY